MRARFMLHSHPATQAAQITSDAMRRVYFEARVQTQAIKTTQKAKRAAIAALALSERVHARVTETLKATPEAWMEMGS